MIQPPRRNLPPDAEPWGRWVEGLLLAQNQSAEANGQSINNTLRGVNASLQQLGNQIQTLSAQQADITTLLSDQVTGATGYNRIALDNPTFPSTLTNYALVTLIVPTGYTKASIIAISSVDLWTFSITTIDMRTMIGGSTSDVSTLDIESLEELVSSSYSSTLSGLSGGQTITIATQVSQSAGSLDAAFISTTAFAMFFK